MGNSQNDEPPSKKSIVTEKADNSSSLTNPAFTSSENQSKKKRDHKWRAWHEREIPVFVEGKSIKDGIMIKIISKQLTTELAISYPNHIWSSYLKENKVKLVDNVTYTFTAHLPFLLKGNIRLEYNTGYPHVYSWANQCFVRFLPAYWFVYRGRRGSTVFPLLKSLLNSRTLFAQTKDIPPRFPDTISENLIIPFTFGKDSFLTYNVAKEIGLNPTLVYFNEPTEKYARKHKLELISGFSQKIGQKVYYMENPLGNLREYGEGWFGWELALTSWALLSLPFAYNKKAGYIVYSNEASCNDFFYDSENLKVVPDYEQSGQATEELSILTQALSEGEVYTTSFLQGLEEIAITSILNQRYPYSLQFLMSCWAETTTAKNKRWCAECSKCARIFLYLVANGIDPQRQAGFSDNLLQDKYERLYNIFGRKAEGTGFDAFGTNRDEQLLAFYLCHLRGLRYPLIKRFEKSSEMEEAKERFQQLFEHFYNLQEEYITPPQWSKKINNIFQDTLVNIRKEIISLKNLRS